MPSRKIVPSIVFALSCIYGGIVMEDVLHHYIASKTTESGNFNNTMAFVLAQLAQADVILLTSVLYRVFTDMSNDIKPLRTSLATLLIFIIANMAYIAHNAALFMGDASVITAILIKMAIELAFAVPLAAGALLRYHVLKKDNR